MSFSAGQLPARTQARAKIGLLALTLDFYETLAPTLRPSREAWIRDSLIPNLQPFADLLFTRALFRREHIEAAIAEYTAAGADALLVLHATYSPSQIALPALAQTRLPILIWNTQELLAVDKSFTVEAMIDNHGVHGTQDLANVLLRSHIPFHYVTSPPQDRLGLQEIADFCAAAAAVNRLRKARIGSIGYPFPAMGDFAIDSTHLAATLGCSCLQVPIEEYIFRAQTAPESDVSNLIHEYRKEYDVAADVTLDDLRDTARAEFSIRAIIAEARLDSLTYQFLAFGQDQRTQTLPFVGASRFMAEGIGFAGEGDFLGAAYTAFLNWLQPPATFSEIFTIDFAGNSLFMSHMGEANVAMARTDRKVPLVARATPITPTRGRQLALVTSLKPGPATLSAIALGPANKWRMISALISIEDFGPLPGFSVPHFKLKPASTDVRSFLTNYAMAGGPHHNAVSFGDTRRRLRFAAQLVNADCIEL